MAEIFDIFAVIGFCTTINFIAKIFHERKMNKLADETCRRLLEQRRREQLQVEWSNMTRANTPAIFNQATGRWLVSAEKQ